MSTSEPVEDATPTAAQVSRAHPVLSVLAAVAFINWSVCFAVSVHLGGDAIGVVPSAEGFVITSHGRSTPVTESVWLFSLLYPYCTLMLTPAVALLYASRFKPLRGLPVLPRRLVRVFIPLWALLWYVGITQAFVQSMEDHARLRQRTHPVHAAAALSAGDAATS